MTKVFHSPPNWPAPPAGWSPGPGWSPDPRWGPAPSGWEFWVELPSPSPMPAPQDDGDLRVFISYRRADTRSHVNGLYDGLATRLPEAVIFMDLDSIPAGVDFEEHIRTEISRCDVVLVVIGDDWLTADPATGTRRIDHPDDFVRLEIENALVNPRVVVIPVLVEGAAMPASTDLPDAIRRISRINALRLDDTRWRTDIARLVDRISEIGEGRPTPSARRRETGPSATDARAPAPAHPVGPASFGASSFGSASGSASVQLAGPVSPTASGPSRMSAGQVALSVLMCVLPVLSVGQLGWVPPLVAASTRVPPGSLRRRLRGAAIGLGAAVVLSWVLAVNSPQSPSGGYTGWTFGVAVLLWLGTIVAGTWIAIVFWKPRAGSAPPTLR